MPESLAGENIHEPPDLVLTFPGQAFSRNAFARLPETRLGQARGCWLLLPSLVQGPRLRACCSLLYLQRFWASRHVASSHVPSRRPGPALPREEPGTELATSTGIQVSFTYQARAGCHNNSSILGVNRVR